MHDPDQTWRRGYRYALALCGVPAEAEDLLHDGWAASLRHHDVPPPPYLFRAIRSRWIDRHRRSQVVEMQPMDREPASEARGPALQASDRERVAWALSLLRPDEREVLFLAAVEGYTAQEIGEMTERPRGTVLSLLHRARQRVRNTLELDAQEVVG